MKKAKSKNKKYEKDREKDIKRKDTKESKPLEKQEKKKEKNENENKNLEKTYKKKAKSISEKERKSKNEAVPKTATKKNAPLKNKDTIIGVMDPNGYAFRETFEKLLTYLNLEIEYKGTLHKVKTQRISTRPYDVLQAQCPYNAIINRGAHWNPHHNSFFMTVGHQSYLLNDMISFKSINKNTSYGHMAKLGLHVPATIALPQQDYEELKADAKAIPELIFSDHEFFNLQEIGELVGYPAFLKPQSGGGWVGVSKVDNVMELEIAYNKSGDKPMNLQKAIDFKEFVRTVGIGPMTIPMHYNPDAKLSHNRYMRSENQAIEFNFMSPKEEEEIKKICKIINAFYKWDHNSCETLIGHDGVCYPIDFANAYPDSSLVSLHFHFPQIVINMAKWLVFCSITGKKKSFNFAQDWNEYFKVMNTKMSYEEKLDAYSDIADKYYETKKFEQFCKEKLDNFDEKALEFFSSDEFMKILEKEISYYFKIPEERPHQVAHYQGIHNFWLTCQKDQLAK